MQLFPATLKRAIPLALVLGICLTAVLDGQNPATPPKPDNTAVNKRDQNRGAVTADQQKMNSVDRAITARIRKSLIADKSLSLNAHNVKIISRDGTVTLKGPVGSEGEVKTILTRALEVTGTTDKIINEMSVQ